jgi:wyosine [tRNA(Phe)-imidazoG37] synthetase (radical SAM superfamily)
MRSRHTNGDHGKNGSGKNNGYTPLHYAITHETAFGYPRDFLQNQYVYLVISPRAHGLSVGINLNPIVKCTFDCIYCEVDRKQAPRATNMDIDRMAHELRETLELAQAGSLRQWPRYASLPEDLLQVRHVALSGDGEPTLAAEFTEAMEAVAHVRAMTGFFKTVLITNSTALDQPQVRDGLKFMTREDEIWAKLDGGTQEYISKVNGATVSLKRILDNILLIGRQRPIVIQSLFPSINGAPPSVQEIEAYAQRLKELKQAGAEISLVQIYSATRPMARLGCGHLQLKTLSEIAQAVRKVTGLRAEVY